jgi:hypothetical protein
MKTTLGCRLIRATAACLFAMVGASICFAQSKGRLDVMTYSLLPGFIEQRSENPAARAFAKIYPGDKFLLVTLYASTNSFGDPDTDFSRRWKQLMASMTALKSTPKTERSSMSGATAVMGYDSITFKAIQAVGVLTTITVGGKLITLTGMFNDTSAVNDFQTFLGGIDLDDELVYRTTTRAAPHATSAPSGASTPSSPVTGGGLKPPPGSFVVPELYPKISDLKMRCSALDGEYSLMPVVGGAPAQHVHCKTKKDQPYSTTFFNTIGVP